MAEKRIVGVSSIKIGDIALDGGPGLTLAALGGTYKDSASFEEEEGSDVEHEIEESDDPVEVLSAGEKKTITWGIVNMDPAVVVKVLGGTATGTGATAKWERPATKPLIYQTVEVTDKNGVKTTYPRVRIKARKSWKITKTGILQIIITGRIMTPEKAGVASEIQLG